MSEGPWPIVSLGELIASIEAGASFRCRETPPEADEVGVAKVSAVSWGRYDENESKTCLNASRIDPSLLIQKGDFLISRANTVQLVGACVIAERVTKQVMLSDKTLRIQFRDPSLKPWVLHYLRSREGRNQIEALCTGNQESMRNISQKSIRQIQLPLAPAEERDRVVAYLDQQLSRLQASVEIFGIIQAKLKQARASILKAAVEGRLVETEAELARANGIQFKSGGQLLVEISSIAKRRNQGMNMEASDHNEQLEIDGLALPIPPEGWSWTTMNAIASTVRNGYSGKPSDQGPVKILRISSVRPLSVDHTDTRSLPGIISDYGKAIAQNGCLLITRYNGNPNLVGVMGHYRSQDPVVHPDKLIRVELTSEKIRPEWIEIAFNAGLTRSLLQKRVRTTAGQAGISGQDVKSMPVPVPPTEEQIRIIQEVQRRFSVLDQVEATVTTSLARCGNLRQAMLRKAFISTG